LDADDGTSTTAAVAPDPDVGRRAVWIRRGFIALLGLVVLAGLLHLLGVKSRTVDARSRDGTISLSVHYAQIARAGLDVPFRITVQRSDGFDQDVTIAVDSEYLDLFDRNSIDPEPKSATATADAVIWQFEPPPGDTLEISVDMQVQGGRHWGRTGTVALLDDSGSTLLQVQFKTWLAP
jgi:hypothetical protein